MGAMTIDADVAAVAKQWGLDPVWVQGIVTQEGNILKAVQCSMPSIQTREAALQIVCRSLVHRMGDYMKMLGVVSGFVAFFGGHWAPVGADNDPRGLNVHWVPNVRKLWGVDGSEGRKA